MNTVLRRGRLALARPGLVLPFLVEQVAAPIGYRLGDGSRALTWPSLIKLYVNSSCNASCRMCDVGLKNRESVFYRQLIRPGTSLSIEACARLVEQVRGFAPRISISGVEPLLHDGIADIVGIIKRGGLYCSLTTNGILLSRHAGELVRRGIDAIAVSVDGPEEVHDGIRGAGVYRKAIDGIRAVKALRAAAKSRIPSISVACCITDTNYGALTDLADSMIESEQVDFVSFTHPYYVTEQASKAQVELFGDIGESTPVSVAGMDLERIDTDVLWKQIARMHSRFSAGRVVFNIEMKDKARLVDYYRYPERPISPSRCLIPWRRATILANGDAIVHNRCVAYTTGNILATPFATIWNGRAYRTFRRRLRQAGHFPVCARCCGVV